MGPGSGILARAPKVKSSMKSLFKTIYFAWVLDLGSWPELTKLMYKLARNKIFSSKRHPSFHFRSFWSYPRIHQFNLTISAGWDFSLPERSWNFIVFSMNSLSILFVCFFFNFQFWRVQWDFGFIDGSQNLTLLSVNSLSISFAFFLTSWILDSMVRFRSPWRIPESRCTFGKFTYHCFCVFPYFFNSRRHGEILVSLRKPWISLYRRATHF